MRKSQGVPVYLTPNDSPQYTNTITSETTSKTTSIPQNASLLPPLILPIRGSQSSELSVSVQPSWSHLRSPVSPFSIKSQSQSQSHTPISASLPLRHRRTSSAASICKPKHTRSKSQPVLPIQSRQCKSKLTIVTSHLNYITSPSNIITPTSATNTTTTSPTTTTTVVTTDSLLKITSLFLLYMFQNLYVSSSSLEYFVKEVIKRSKCSLTVFQISVYYLVQLYNTPKYEHFLKCGKKAWLGCLVLASKYHQDKNFTLKVWNKITGLSIKELTSTETIILEMLDYNLFIKESVFQEFQSRLSQALNVLSVPTSLLPTPTSPLSFSSISSPITTRMVPTPRSSTFAHHHSNSNFNSASPSPNASIYSNHSMKLPLQMEIQKKPQLNILTVLSPPSTPTCSSNRTPSPTRLLQPFKSQTQSLTTPSPTSSLSITPSALSKPPQINITPCSSVGCPNSSNDTIKVNIPATMNSSFSKYSSRNVELFKATSLARLFNFDYQRTLRQQQEFCLTGNGSLNGKNCGFESGNSVVNAHATSVEGGNSLVLQKS
ncbi:unnamed protein product [Ambrosiozyma monospora]|uniref:Unnamed protein product n=1 Tax=Ambrosiozyma monospora TaxID=43982 RepID=A0A9W6SV72_AMBMO|nr:unnamed protein product [Ambrosiozyma monospora]